MAIETVMFSQKPFNNSQTGYNTDLAANTQIMSNKYITQVQ